MYRGIADDIRCPTKIGNLLYMRALNYSRTAQPNVAQTAPRNLRSLTNAFEVMTPKRGRVQGLSDRLRYFAIQTYTSKMRACTAVSLLYSYQSKPTNL